MRLLSCSLLLTSLALGCAERASPPAETPAPPRSNREILATSSPKGETPVDRELVARIAAATANPKKADAWILVGRAWVQKARNSADPGYYLNADAAAELALELEPLSPLAQDLRGLVLLSDHRFADAKRLAEATIARAPSDAAAYGVLSDALLELGDVAGARDAAEKMMALKPDLPSYSRISYLRWLVGDSTGAIEAMRLAFDAGRGQKDKEPGAWALTQAATYFWLLGDVEGAGAGYELALQYMKDYAPALVGRARVAMARAKPAAAIELLRSAQALHPAPETLWLLGDALDMAGDAAGASKAYAELVELAKRSDPRTLAAFYASRARDVEEAVRLAKSERDKRPGPVTRDVYAFALLRAGKIAEAKAELEPVIALGLREPGLRFHEALLALASGEAARGKRLLVEVLATHPHFDRAAVSEARRLLGS